MKKRFKNFLKKLGEMLLSWSGTIYYIEDNESQFQKDVVNMVNQVEEKFKDESGEFKRSQVLRAVMNMYPQVLEKDIAFSIELAVRIIKNVR